MPFEYLDRVSVFETLRAYDGKIFRVGDHLKRLSESCEGIGHRLPYGNRSMERWLYSVLAESGYSAEGGPAFGGKNAILRVSIHWSGKDDGEIVLFVRPFESHPREWYKKGVAVRSAVRRRPSAKAQNSQIKSSQYAGAVLALLDGRPAGRPHEYLFFSSDGTVAEGSVSNIFAIKAKRVLTPPVASGILRGVTRQFVMELAKKSGLTVLERPLTRHEIYTADECFITNTSSEILPVVNVDGRKIGSGRPGQKTKKLGELFKKHR